ncbi:MAG TPA: GNAT family N-acetyltransferase [Caulobacteraceae bacterium]|nr:GNAT family N-acetyltransferase [Caulobacteraceae bacterium]
MDPERIRRAAEAPVQAVRADLPEIVQTLSDAFAVDPHLDWLMRVDARREAARHAFFRLLIAREGMAKGRIDRPAGGGAAAIWMPFEWLGPAPALAGLLSLPLMLRTTGLARFGRMMAIRADMDRHHPMDRPHAYLWFLGVAPAAQGRGVGSALLRAANARLDAARMPAYLETGTRRNVALYQRHGFRVLSEHKARPDAPTMWSMWREPAGG